MACETNLVQKTAGVVLLVVFLTAGLVENLLCIALVVVALGATNDLVGKVGNALFGTVQGGLGGIGSLWIS